MATLDRARLRESSHHFFVCIVVVFFLPIGRFRLRRVRFFRSMGPASWRWWLARSIFFGVVSFVASTATCGLFAGRRLRAICRSIARRGRRGGDSPCFPGTSWSSRQAEIMLGKRRRARKANILAHGVSYCGKPVMSIRVVFLKEVIITNHGFSILDSSVSILDGSVTSLAEYTDVGLCGS